MMASFVFETTPVAINSYLTRAVCENTVNMNLSSFPASGSENTLSYVDVVRSRNGGNRWKRFQVEDVKFL